MNKRREPDYTLFDFTISNKFVSIFITDTPKDSSIESFTQFMNERGITDIFCFSEVEYNTPKKINLHHLEFPDGSHPSQDILNQFDEIIDNIILKSSDKISLLFHCRAGLGRAPIILAYLMISRLGMNPLDCAEMIRNKRRGSINKHQLEWLLSGKIKKINKEKCTIL